MFVFFSSYLLWRRGFGDGGRGGDGREKMAQKVKEDLLKRCLLCLAL